jgi:hypothetical protein
MIMDKNLVCVDFIMTVEHVVFYWIHSFWKHDLARNDINLDMLIWLSESSLSLIRDNQGRETVWLSKGQARHQKLDYQSESLLSVKPW